MEHESYHQLINDDLSNNSFNIKDTDDVRTFIPPMKKCNPPVETVPYLHSVIPQNRLDFLAEKCRESLLKVPGNVLEIGVYRGGSLARLASIVKDVCPQFQAIGIDTFTGHPYSDNHPVHPTGKYADANLKELGNALDRAGLGSWITLHQGRVEEVFRSLNIGEVAFAHIDCDLYIPIKYCATEVPRVMLHDGLMYFDDYGHDHCPGATRAVQEIFSVDRLTEVFMADDGTCWSCYLDASV
jgi:hypothetical protein